jgi:hypothetical protein
MPVVAPGLGRLPVDLVGTVEGKHGQKVPAGTWYYGAIAARVGRGEPEGVAVLVRLTPKDHGVAIKAWYELVVLAEAWREDVGDEPERARPVDIVEVVAAVDERIGLELRRLGARITMRGFRHGHVPLSFVAQRFGPRVYAEVAYGIVLARCAEVKLDGQGAQVIAGGVCAPGRPFSCLVVAPPAPSAAAAPPPGE